MAQGSRRQRITYLLLSGSMVISAACNSDPDRFEDKVTAVRKQGHAVEQGLRDASVIARDLPVLWADGKVVRYWADGGQAKTESWGEAALDRERGSRLKEFLRRNDLALYVRDRRVYFSVTGIAETYAGRAAGWIHAPTVAPDCEPVHALDFNRPGIQCMEFSPALFVYIHQ